MALIDKLTAIADGFRSSRGTTDTLTLDEMAVLAGEQVDIGGGSDGSPVVVECVVNVGAVVGIKIPSGVEYYYNHEQFPEIPADVVAKYPYILIMRTLSVTRIYASPNIFYYHVTDDGTKRIDGTGNVVRYTYNSDADAWVFDGSSTYGFNMYGNSHWVVWWSNYDIPNGSPDAEEIYFPASPPQAEQPAEATYYYYNGVRLPKIPDEESGTYPYMAMWGKTLYVGAKKIYFYSTSNYPSTVKCDGKAKRYSYDEATSSWALKDEHESLWYIVGNDFIWGNYDVPNGSETATDIYYYGTLAVPDPE